MAEPLFREERAAAGEPEGLLVLHHGRGTDERDLLGLADLLDPERRLRVVTPRAPLTLPGSPGYHWYLVPRVGHPDPETFEAARAALSELHDGLWEEGGFGTERSHRHPLLRQPRPQRPGDRGRVRPACSRAAGRRRPRRHLPRVRAGPSDRPGPPARSERLAR